MVEQIIAGGANTRQLPLSIKKIEDKEYDEYIGSAGDLVAAGLVQASQFPPKGRRSITFMQGKVVHRHCKRDETYLRVAKCDDGDSWAVRHGLQRGELLKRRAAASDANRARWMAEEAAEDAEKRAKAAAKAQHWLNELPKSRIEFIRDQVSHVRGLFMVGLDRLDDPTSWHGYRFSTTTKEAAMMAVDAVVEALVQGEVILDEERHATLVQECRSKIRAADPGFERHFQALTSMHESANMGGAQ